MSDTSLLVLKEQFYDELYNKLNTEKKLVEDSVFKYFLWSQSNQVLEYLSSVAISSENIDPATLDELVKKEFVRGGSEFSKYVVTAKGVWEVETRLDKIDLQRLLDYVDERKYLVKWGGDLSNKEMVVILSLIALRAFYEKTPLNRKNGERSLDNINEVINKSSDFFEGKRERF